ncbi:hypothetical protein [Consotaella salsifontis]|uniref:Uncharacterized protein n=1 Tax=Consotaella salsifontis TaxID=1365950 RepID=A0A1T4SQQ8_9HYPH|nr:hypothetical protein [Consotaella salsifontis]SKA30522.1 hypothetical protein SAMN05428963_11324 [Consotaella salsifontis]
MASWFDRITLRQIAFGAGAALVCLFAIGWATRDPPADKPYLKIAGSGFMFNYRVADAYYGFTAYVQKPVRNLSLLEASFEDPAGGPPHVVSTRLSPRTRQYSLRSPPLSGIEKDRPYGVDVRLIQAGDGAVLFSDHFTVTSQIADDILPKEPLTIGPGYTRNPRLSVDENHRG